MDDMSKMWTALQASYRTTVAYDVSLVLIEREVPVRPSLPVLTRGGLADPVTGRDPGVLLQPDVAETAPTLVVDRAGDRQPVMRLGREMRLLGHGLDRGDARVRFAEPGTGGGAGARAGARRRRRTGWWCGCPRAAPLAATHPLAGTGADPGAWRIGVYTVLVRLTEPSGRETLTNALPVALAPATTSAAAPVPGGTAITMTDRAAASGPGRASRSCVGQRMALVPSPVAPADQAQAVFTGARLRGGAAGAPRVDGVDSPVDRPAGGAAGARDGDDPMRPTEATPRPRPGASRRSARRWPPTSRRCAAWLEAGTAATPPAASGRGSTLDMLAALFDLDPAERLILCLAAAAELDAGGDRGGAQGDRRRPGRRRPRGRAAARGRLGRASAPRRRCGAGG